MSTYKVEICGVNTAQLPILKEEEKDELFKKIKAGDKASRETYIKGNLRLVLSVIKRFNNHNENVDDLFQIGCIGLMKAIDNFDTSVGVKFSTYAVPMIIGEIRRYLRDNSSYRIPRSLRDIAYKAMQAKERLAKNAQKEPTLEEIANECEIPVEDVVYALDAIQTPLSLFDRSLASSVIGFTSSGNVGTTGLENYYNSTLNGINGREYGYLDSDSDFEKTVIDAQDGDTLVTSIDANIQSIVEEKIKDWNEKYRDNYYKGTGSINTAAIVMNPNNGEILAMADYPNVDLNNPRDLGKWYTKKQIKRMSEDDKMDALNEIWQNFCVSSTYEPGSVQKPFTVACGLETGTIKDKMTFDCDGYEDFNGQKVRCVARYGHGIETVRKTLMDSCNDAIMQMSYKIGKNHFTEYQSIYGFGQKTGIDLPGEANTASLMYQVEDMKPIDLATNAFGQNYNCTMVQMVSGFASLINGGTYYQPHLVTKITDSTGNTISTVEPKAVKQTISQSTSDKIRDYLQSVVKEGTGNTAKVDGYSMGGKTGTAQKFPRGNGKYLVSFMGFAPYDNPQVLIYVVVNEPNVADQPHSVFAQNIAREILEEVLPYMNIYPDEKKTGVNKGYDVTGSKDSSQYTGKHNGTKSRNEKKKKN